MARTSLERRCGTCSSHDMKPGLSCRCGETCSRSNDHEDCAEYTESKGPAGPQSRRSRSVNSRGLADPLDDWPACASEDEGDDEQHDEDEEEDPRDEGEVS